MREFTSTPSDGPRSASVTPSAREAMITFDERASASPVPKSVVVDPNFDWKGQPPAGPVPGDQTIISRQP
jgi:hypothetical protein